MAFCRRAFRSRTVSFECPLSFLPNPFRQFVSAVHPEPQESCGIRDNGFDQFGEQGFVECLQPLRGFVQFCDGFSQHSRRVLHVVVFQNQPAGAAQFQQPGGGLPELSLADVGVQQSVPPQTVDVVRLLVRLRDGAVDGEYLRILPLQDVVQAFQLRGGGFQRRVDVCPEFVCKSKTRASNL